jgi:hypothetical protein
VVCYENTQYDIFRGASLEQPKREDIEVVKLENVEATGFQDAVSLKWLRLNIFVVILSGKTRQSAFAFTLLKYSRITVAEVGGGESEKEMAKYSY